MTEGLSFEEMRRSRPPVDPADEEVQLSERLRHQRPAQYSDASEIARRESQRRERDEQRESQDEAAAEREVDDEQSRRRQGAESGGGGGGAAADAAESPGAPEPAPQRDDPDEGEHTDSEPEQDAEPDPEPEATEQPDEADEAEPAVQSQDAEPDEPEPETKQQTKLTAAEAVARQGQWHKEPGSDPKRFAAKQTGLSFSSDSWTRVNKIPNDLIEMLRRRLAPVAGGEFAAKISSQQLVVAFLAVKLSVEIEGLDPDTSSTMNALAQTEPQMDAVAEKVADLDTTMDRMIEVVDAVQRESQRVSVKMDAIEFSQAYALSDRILGMTTEPNDVEGSMAKNEDTVLGTKAAVRNRARAVAKREADREGRRAQ